MYGDGVRGVGMLDGWSLFYVQVLWERWVDRLWEGLRTRFLTARG